MDRVFLVPQDGKTGRKALLCGVVGPQVEPYPELSDSFRGSVLGNRASGSADSRKPGLPSIFVLGNSGSMKEGPGPLKTPALSGLTNTEKLGVTYLLLCFL